MGKYRVVIVGQRQAERRHDTWQSAYASARVLAKVFGEVQVRKQGRLLARFDFEGRVPD